MKRKFFIFGLCAVLILCTSGTALAKLFIVEIDGQRVVVDFWVDVEQAWQYTLPSEPGYWDGLALAPDPYDFKIWYPYLEDMFDKTLKQQEAWIYRLKYGGVWNWRIAYFWDTVPMRASMFGGLDLAGPNTLSDIKGDAYFPPTSCGIFAGGGYRCFVIGRTGNEDGLVTGAIINPWEFLPGHVFPPPPPPNQRYINEGTFAKIGMMGASLYYTLPHSDAQDHWAINPINNSVTYNDDLNYNPDDTTIGQMSPPDEVTGEQPIGAWAVSENMPEIWPPKGQFHEIRISDVVQSTGDLIPVTIVSVMQDEPVFLPRSRADYMRTSPDAIVDTTDEEALIVYLRAERSRSRREDGRVYHITFTDDGIRTFTLKIGVPKERGYEWSILVDGGPLYDSTVIE